MISDGTFTILLKNGVLVSNLKPPCVVDSEAAMFGEGDDRLGFRMAVVQQIIEVGQPGRRSNKGMAGNIALGYALGVAFMLLLEWVFKLLAIS